MHFWDMCTGAVDNLQTQIFFWLHMDVHKESILIPKDWGGDKIHITDTLVDALTWKV